MPTNPLAEYLGQKKAETNQEARSRKQRIAQWKKAVNELYMTIDNLLAGKAKSRRNQDLAYEQHLGSYKIQTLTIEVGPVQIVLKPKGAIIIGAQGRVDMTGPRGAVRFIRIVENGKDEWFLSLDPDPRNLEPLNVQSLAMAFRRVIDGPQTVTRPSPSSKPRRSR